MLNSKAIDLLEQIIEEAQREDLEFKRHMIEVHEADQAVGESWMLYHLKALKELLTS